MAQIHGPTLSLGIDARGAKTGAQHFHEAMTTVTTATDKAERSYRSSAQELNRMSGGLPTTSSRFREMTSSVGGLSSKLTDATSKVRELTRANQELGRSSALLRNLGQGLVQGAGMSLFTMATQLPRQFIEVSASAERMSRSLTVATGSSGEAASVLARLYDISSRLGAPIEGLSQLYVGVARSAGELGASQEQILKVTEGVSAALSLSGTNAASASGGMLQMAQAFASGTVRAEEMNSMIESMPMLMQSAAKHIDGTSGSLGKMRQMVLEGKISSEQFFTAVLKGSEDVKKKADGMEKTWDSAMMGMVNSGQKFITNINQATGVTAGFKLALSALAGTADQVSVALEATMGKIDSQIKMQEGRVAALQRMQSHPGLGNVAKDMLPEVQSQLDNLNKEKSLRTSVGQILTTKADPQYGPTDLRGQYGPADTRLANQRQQMINAAPKESGGGHSSAGGGRVRSAGGSRSVGRAASTADSGEAFENFKDNVAASYWRNSHNEIQAVEEEKRRLLDKLSEIKGGSTADREAVAKQITANAETQLAEIKSRQLDAVNEIVSNSEIMLRQSEERLADSTEKRIEIQLKLVEKRGEAELNVNGGAIPGHCGGVKAGHLGESGATQQGARSGPLLCRRFCVEDQGLLISPVSGSTVSAMVWFGSARSAGVAGRRRPADCFNR